MGPLALGDLDGDGTPELIAAGRYLPSAYPMPCRVMVYRIRHGTLALDDALTQSLGEVGLVSGAVCADLDSDGSANWSSPANGAPSACSGIARRGCTT